jgi:catalase
VLVASATLENSPPALFDALVLPDGDDGAARLARYGQAQEFVLNQYRHGKTILALGAATTLLDGAGIAGTLPSGEPDPGILLASADDLGDGAAAFITAAGRHRHPERESAPLHA